MRHDRVRIKQSNEELIAYRLYHSGGTNKSEIARMKKILQRAIRHELTGRQRDCLTMYYFGGMTMREIAHRLGLSPSTVTRHIKAAQARLRKVASYYL